MGSKSLSIAEKELLVPVLKNLASLLKSKRASGIPNLVTPDVEDSTDDEHYEPHDYKCLKGFLEHGPDESYRFRPDNHHAYVEERPSYRKLTSNWAHASQQSRKDHGSFPDVRKKKAKDAYTDCVLRCTCDTCSKGEAVEIECKPYAFGRDADMVLVHEFPFDGETWAVILGTWADPDEYRPWGSYEKDPSVTGYNRWILLREVHSDESTGSKRSCGTLGHSSREKDNLEPCRASAKTSTAQSNNKRKRSPKSTGSGYPARGNKRRMKKVDAGDCPPCYRGASNENDDDEELEPIKQEASQSISARGLAIRPAPSIDTKTVKLTPAQQLMSESFITRASNTATQNPVSSKPQALSDTRSTPALYEGFKNITVGTIIENGKEGVVPSLDHGSNRQGAATQLDDSDLTSNNDLSNANSQLLDNGLRRHSDKAARVPTLKSIGLSSAFDVEPSHRLDLHKLYGDAVVHVVDLRDSGGRFAIDSNEMLREHVERLSLAADKRDEFAFTVLWNSINHDLATAGLVGLPALKS